MMMISPIHMVCIVYFVDRVGSEPLSDSEDSDIDLPEDEPEQPLVVEKPEKKVLIVHLQIICVGKGKTNSVS